MKCDRKDLLLYAVTDRMWLDGRRLCDDVELSLKGGVTMVQLREKELCHADFLAEAREIKALCSGYGVPFIINDDVDVAVACNADGIHVGQSDLAAGTVRARVGKGKIIGVSAETVEQAILAEKNGADYLGVGAMFTTSTKADAGAPSLETLKAICKAVSIPVVAIGGIGAENIEKLSGSGIAGVALVSAIYAEKDIKKATENMRCLMAEIV